MIEGWRPEIGDRGSEIGDQVTGQRELAAPVSEWRVEIGERRPGHGAEGVGCTGG